MAQVPQLAGLVIRARLHHISGDIVDGDSRIQLHLRRQYPIWGREAAERAAAVMIAMARASLPPALPPSQQHTVSAVAAEWADEIYETTSLYSCVRALYIAMHPFLTAWWDQCLGTFNGAPPSQQYRAARIRGAALYEYYTRSGVAHPIVPQQGMPSTITPAAYGAGADGPWERALRPHGLPCILWWLNPCERRFLFGIVYMCYANNAWPNVGRCGRMMRALVTLVRMRVDQGMDTTDPDIMGRTWEVAWVTAGLLAAQPGQQIAPP